ncbi:MAG: DUF2723 domain-containing protein [Deltaproteobacteria bacterium]|nr:DUF2723 domain-containing protein [Deltaproteobacteria bacterium]
MSYQIWYFTFNAMDSPPSAFYKKKLILPLTLSAITLILYAFTLSPTINFGDSPELISSAYTLGMSHPPGYPLYSLLGKFFSLIPWSDSIARRINLASAFYSAASIFILALLIEISGINYARVGIIFFATFLALSTTLWSQSVVSEVYTLNLLFFSLLLFFTYLWWKKGDRPYLPAGFFLYGLGLANHHTLLPFIPLLIIFLIAGKRNEIKNIPLIFSLIALFILGLSVYIYMPLRSMQSPAMDWGDPENFRQFFDIVLRRHFPTIETSLTLQQAFKQLTWYGSAIVREFTFTGAILALWGLTRSYKWGKPPFLFLFLLFIIHGIATLLVLNPTSSESYKNVSAMLIPSYAIMALWIGLAVSNLTSIIVNRKGGHISLTVLFAAISASLIYNAPSVYQKNDESNNYFALDYASNIFNSIDEKGVIFVESDTALFPLWYLQFVEGARPDVAVIDVDFLMLPWFKGQIRERYKNIDIKVEDLGKHSSRSGKKVAFADMLDAFKVNQVDTVIEDIIAIRPIYISYEFGPVYRQFKEIKGIYVINEGLIYKVSKTYEKPAVKKWDTFNFRSLLQYNLKDDLTVKVLASAYINPLKRKGQLLYDSGKRDEAMKILKRIKEIEAGAAGVK